MTDTRRGSGEIHVLPEGVLDTKNVPVNVQENVFAVYTMVQDNGRPMCFDEIQTALKKRAEYLPQEIDSALDYLIEHGFLVRTSRHEITAYDTKSRGIR